MADSIIKFIFSWRIGSGDSFAPSQSMFSSRFSVPYLVVLLTLFLSYTNVSVPVESDYDEEDDNLNRTDSRVTA
jgi:hypothetical protein